MYYSLSQIVLNVLQQPNEVGKIITFILQMKKHSQRDREWAPNYKTSNKWHQFQNNLNDITPGFTLDHKRHGTTTVHFKLYIKM